MQSARKCSLYAAIGIVSIAASAIAFAQQNQTPPPPGASSLYAKIPLSFEANHGQTDPSVQFLSHGQGYTLFLSHGEAVLSLSPQYQHTSQPRDQNHRSIVSMQLFGANRHAIATQQDQQITRTNYLIGNDPTKWRTDIPNYGRVRYTDVYDGIDLVYYGNQRSLEHDFIVSPHADPSQIVLSFQGAKKLRIDPQTGDLILNAGHGELRLLKPLTYQESNHRREEIPSHYKLLAQNEVSFSISAYDHAQALIIDPVLTYSTFLGSTQDPVNAIAVDFAGNAYVTGSAYAGNKFPLSQKPFQSSNAGTENCFITKILASGTALAYSTYLGGDFYDQCSSIAVDSHATAYVTGSATSNNFPTTAGAFRESNSATNYASKVFVTRLNPAGSALVYSTYLGGTGGDQGNSIAIDSTGNAYVTGFTHSTDLPVTNAAFQTTNKSSAQGTAFVSVLNPTGTAQVYSTYLGGSFGGAGNGVAVDASGNAYACGYTQSSDFPTTPGSFLPTDLAQSPYEGRLGFVTKFNPTGTALLYSTYLGYGLYNEYTVCNAIAVDATGSAYVTGATSAMQFPVTTGVVQPVTPTPNNYTDLHAFVTKFNPAGSALSYSTYLGGSNSDSASAIVIDNLGNAIIAGTTSSADFPTTPAALQTTNRQQPAIDGSSGTTAFASKLNATASALIYSTFLGGSTPGTGGDYASGLATDSSGNLYIVGTTGSTDFLISPNAYEKTPDSLIGFVAKLAIGTGSAPQTGTTTTIVSSANPSPSNFPVTLTAKVTNGTSGTTPTGSVIFNIDNSNVATVPLDSSGQAQYTTSSLGITNSNPIAYHAVVAHYNGSPTLDISTGDLGQVIEYNVAVSVTNTPNPQLLGLPVTITATVTTVGLNNAIPTGTLTFTESGGGSVTVPLDSTGRATYTTGPTSPILSTPGYHLIIANYNGTSTLNSYSLFANQTMVAPTISLVSAPPVTVYGKPFASPLVLQVTGIGATPLTGRSIAFNGPGLSFSPATATTDVNGHVSTSVTPTRAGALLATASMQIGGITTSTGFPLVSQKATLRVQPETIGTNYGHPVPVPTVYFVTGLVNGDTPSTAFTGTPGFQYSATSTSPVGQYPLTLTQGTLQSTNYAFQFFPYTVQIFKAPLTGTIQNVAIHRGDPIPAFTFTWSGFVNGDTAATAVTGAPVITTTATSSTSAGHFPISGTLGTLHSQNYYFIGVSGTLTILP